MPVGIGCRPVDFFMFFSRQFLATVFLGAFGRGKSSAEKQLDDDVLVERIAAGDERALEILYDRYQGLVYSLMLRMLGDSGQAEEVTLDAFTRVWQQAAVYRASRAAVKTWLVNIARNRAIDVLRMRRSRVDGNSAMWADGELESLADNGTPEQNVTEFDMRSRVRAAIAELPEEQRAVLALAYFEGLSHSQIAEQLQQPLGTVKGRVRNAMRTLQEKFAEDF